MAKHRNPLPTPEERAERKRTKNLQKLNKLIIVIAALAVLVAAFFTYSYFCGNPFSKMTAEKNIKLHIEQNYPSLELSAVKYDRETSAFYAEATSKTSVDTHFYVYAKGSEVWDYYEDSVKELFNTIERVENTFTEVAKTALTEKGTVAKDGSVTVAVLDFIASRESGSFTLDMQVSSDIQNDFAVYVELEKTASVQTAAEALVEIKTALDTADLPNIALYNLTLVEDGKELIARNVPAEDIGEGLLQKLSHALENPSSSLGAGEDERPLRVSIE